MWDKLFKKKEVSSVEKYLSHLDNIFQVTPEFYKNESPDSEYKGVSSIVYKDIPKEGFITGFTYGLSFVKHSDWNFGRGELSLTVRSECIEWGLAVG